MMLGMVMVVVMMTRVVFATGVDRRGLGMGVVGNRCGHVGGKGRGSKQGGKQGGQDLRHLAFL